MRGIEDQADDSRLAFHSDWYYNFEYLEEQNRDLDFREDLFSHGTFSTILATKDRLGVIVSTLDPTGRDATELLQLESSRRRSPVARFPLQDELLTLLGLAADQFIVAQPPDEAPTDATKPAILAGYHWFEDWGRDTMIGLTGLTPVTGRFETAREILRRYVVALDQGMLPNRFPGSGSHPEYNTVDASLWFFVAVYRYWLYTGDSETVRREFLPAMAEILEWYRKGTRFGIHVESDGLLAAGEAGTQLTWMDAKIGSWAVTPRNGKPVEVNALWYNALRILAAFEAELLDPAAVSRLESGAEKVRVRFREVFWDEALGYLYDCVNGEVRDAAVRPNQIFALSLPFPLLPEPEAWSVLEVVRNQFKPRWVLGHWPQGTRIFVPTPLGTFTAETVPITREQSGARCSVLTSPRSGGMGEGIGKRVLPDPSMRSGNTWGTPVLARSLRCSTPLRRLPLGARWRRHGASAKF